MSWLLACALVLQVRNSVPERTAAALQEILPALQVEIKNQEIYLEGSSDDIARAQSVFYQFDRPLDQVLIRVNSAVASCRSGRTVKLPEMQLEITPEVDGEEIRCKLKMPNKSLDCELGQHKLVTLDGLTISAELLR